MTSTDSSPSLYQNISRVFLFISTGGLIAAVVTMGILGVTQPIFRFAPLDFIAVGLLSFLFIFAIEGITGLLWQIISAILEAMKLESANAWLEENPSTPWGRTLGCLLYVFGRFVFPESFLAMANAHGADMLVILAAMAGGLTAGLFWKPGSSRTTRIAGGAFAAVPVILAASYLIWPGSPEALVPGSIALAETPINLPDPSQPGPYAMREMSYGSGNDPRPEYGAEADILTNPVDGSAVYAGFNGLGDRINRLLWGYGTEAYPLNGLVWAPEGEGPWPLVLVVHGNHNSRDASDPGYAYLCEHLASHGMITVSIDENALNGLLMIDGRGAEMPMRAWVLLKHIGLWEEMSADPGNPFYGQVDMDHIALIGHSRGGEAIQHAADVNAELHTPYTGALNADEIGFNIEAVVSIAPSDGMYQPDGKKISLEDTSLLVIDGAHDADTSTFFGLGAYNRASFTGEDPDAFKAVFYPYRANHGQFNSGWGYGDKPALDWLLLNRSVLLTESEQQSAAKAAITAFLKAAFGQEPGYRAFFTDPGGAAHWLPEDHYLTAYEGADFQPVDVSRFVSKPELIEVEGGEARALELIIFETKALMLRDDATPQDAVALHLTWEAGSSPELRYTWPLDAENAPILTGGSILTFGLFTSNEDFSAEDITITLETADGVSASRPLSDFMTLEPPLRSDALKDPWLSKLLGAGIVYDGEPENLLQTCTVSLAAFADADPGFDPGTIMGIIFQFNGDKAGEIYLDQAGFH